MSIRDNTYFSKPHIYKNGADYVYCLLDVRVTSFTAEMARDVWVSVFASRKRMPRRAASILQHRYELFGNAAKS